jgi:hypothetical protein
MTRNGAVDPSLAAENGELLEALRQMWDERDPVPPDLADRLSFALCLENLEVELLHLVEETVAPLGARAEECARTVTFSSETFSVMITIQHETTTAVRLDGWIHDGGGLQVGLRTSQDERMTAADEDGRFSFDAVVPGLAQLVFHPTQGATVQLRNAVVTPAIKF